jgi:hypothetical protein
MQNYIPIEFPDKLAATGVDLNKINILFKL